MCDQQCADVLCEKRRLFLRYLGGIRKFRTVENK